MNTVPAAGLVEAFETSGPLPGVRPPPAGWHVFAFGRTNHPEVQVMSFSRSVPGWQQPSSSVWREAKSIPLSAYVIAAGTLVAAPFLLVNFVLAPSKPASSAHAATSVEASLHKPGTTAGSTRNAVGTAALAFAAESQDASPERTDGSAQPAYQQSSRDAKRAQSRGGMRAYAESRSPSYARTGPNGRSSAEGTLGPH